MESASDLLTFVGPPFGTEVQIGSATVWAIFTAGFAESHGVPGARPSLTCRSSDVATISRGATVTVPNVGTFTVVEVRPDGSGISRVGMERT